MILLAFAIFVQAAPAASTQACVGGQPAMAGQDCPRFIFFDSAAAEIRREWQAVLDAAATRAGEVPGARVIVSGHSDRTGPALANRRMSLARAELVRKELIARGIPADAIVTEGHGEERLLVPTDDGVREPQNRRVEIRIIAAP